MGKCPEPATRYFSANASPYLHLPQVFFSYTFSLGCRYQIKDFPKVFLNVPPSKLHLFQQNKIQFFPLLKQSYFSKAAFPHPPSLNTFFFSVSKRVRSRATGKREESAADCPDVTGKGEHHDEDSGARSRSRCSKPWPTAPLCMGSSCWDVLPSSSQPVPAACPHRRLLQSCLDNSKRYLKYFPNHF